ncbi:MAG: exodeoxyribonuclease V subunit gamma [Clostridia bacterium]|nr:exodeoxyribonuclease V subunit gamma [Clostridia bacterium]
MIRFIYGADEAAKSDALLTHIKACLDDGGKAILLLPEQETVLGERRMVDLLPPTAQLSFEVSNFTRLANRIFRTCGGLSCRYASPGTLTLLMWKTLRHVAPMLTQYAKHAATDLRLTERMLSAVAQFKAYAVTPDMLTAAREELDLADPLGTKLADLALVLGAYTAEVAQRFDDTADDLTRATGLIAEHPALFSDTHIFISSFTDFTAQELKLLQALLKTAPSVTVLSPLAHPKQSGIHLASALATNNRLLRLARECDKRVFFEVTEGPAPRGALDYIRRDLFDLFAEPAPLGAAAGEAVTLTACATPYDEAEYAAVLIARAVRKGACYRDFTIVVRDVASYAGILDAALEKEGIPFYLSEKTDITVRPLIKLLLFALRIGRFGWQREDIVGYLKTGLTDIPADDINFFEEYAEVWHISGKRSFEAPFTMNADGYSERTSARAARILEGANRARAALLPPLLSYLEALEGASVAAEFAEHTYRFLCDLGVPDTMKARAAARLAAGERREAEEETRLFGVVVDALEAVADVLADEPLDLSSFADALTLLMNTTDIGTIPTSADEVMIGSAATLRALPPRTAIVLGLCDGIFPQAVRDNGLLSDAEKHRLADLGIELSADLATSASDELYYLYRALTLPREQLHLSYSRTTADGSHAEPSIGISRIKALFPQLPVTDFAAVAPRDKIFSRAGAMEHLRELQGAEREALLSLLNTDTDTREKIAHLLTPVTDRTATVPPALAGDLFPPGAFHPTGLEQFVSCKFAYYCDRILRLRQEPSDTLDAAAIGTFIHYVLEKAMKAISECGADFADCDEQKMNEIVAESMAAYRAHLIEAGGGISPRAEVLLTRLSSLARIVVSSLVAEFADSDFAPAFFELDLRGQGGEATVTLQDGSVIPLSGKADRVDVYRAENGEVFVRVADYKTGRKSFRREDIKEGYCLQMPLYLFALCSGTHPALTSKLGLPEGTRFLPAGVTYLSTAVGSENTPVRIQKEQALQSAAERLKREGLLPDSDELLHAISRSKSTAILGAPRTRNKKKTSPEGFAELFAELTDTVSRISSEMKSGAAHAQPTERGGRNACDFCGFSAVCRAKETKK